MDLGKINTELRNSRTKDIDSLSTFDMCKLMNDENSRIMVAIEEKLPEIAQAIDLISESLGKGGRLFYTGAGTSGRLGILDAVECPPTFSTPENLIQGVIAGGNTAIFKAKEGAEDNELLGGEDLEARSLSDLDVVVGIAASGRTPYVIGALKYAKKIGAKTIGIACTSNAQLSDIADLSIEVITGPEVITGSTRLKAGTAQKIILNMFSTGAMIKLGKTYGNLMVDVKATNKKLYQRSVNIIKEITGCSDEIARQLLSAGHNQVKACIVMYKMNLNYDEAEKLLLKNKGILKDIIG